MQGWWHELGLLGAVNFASVTLKSDTHSRARGSGRRQSTELGCVCTHARVST